MLLWMHPNLNISIKVRLLDGYFIEISSYDKTRCSNLYGWSHYVDFIWIDFTTVSSYKNLRGKLQLSIKCT